MTFKTSLGRQRSPQATVKVPPSPRDIPPLSSSTCTDPPLPHVNCKPFPPILSKQEVWAYGYHFDHIKVYKRMAEENAELEKITPEHFAIQLPAHIRKLVDTRGKATEVRLIEGKNVNHLTPDFVVTLFRLTAKAMADLPLEEDVEVISDLMGCEPEWWQVVIWDI
ncbi:uncharacterized protein BXZ73DRAFT_72934 [Epithele typhae]|uniref:uncharacterized protein n=1 Tax=Epithele typhae TaxID=378194 RepID=UPI0020082DAD|nr:uncharacterized protein BXZ73DRAFT_72934 [Epithele typhae]KAH9946086.1 hypothetical protein BXZ73DRAFT_72934 [Epithele typhae]